MSDTITLTGADGSEYECRILQIFELDGCDDGLLVKAEDETSTVLMRLISRDNQAIFRTIEDDAEFERAKAYIHGLVDQHLETMSTKSREAKLSAKWLACQDPCTLTSPIAHFASLREWRLCLVAFCRRVSQWQSDDKIRAGIDLAERLAEGAASDEERLSLLADAVLMKACSPLQVALEGSENIEELVEAASAAAYATGNPKSESAAQCDIIRDILGNPFQPVKTGRLWRAAMTGPPQELAEKIYTAESFADMRQLGGVLRQAASTSSQIQDHCQKSRLHVRGCWLLDGLLGKRADPGAEIIEPRWAEDWLADD